MEMEMISCPLTVFVEKKWVESSLKHIISCASNLPKLRTRQMKTKEKKLLPRSRSQGACRAY